MSNFYTDNSNICDNSTTDYLLPSNLIPHEWYKKFSDNNGKPDSVAIHILSEIMGWHRFFSKTNDPKKYISNNIELPQLIEDNLSVSYSYLTEKLHYSKDIIRRAFVRLEKFGVLKRKICNMQISIGSRVNKLFIRIDDNFFKSCFLSPKLDIRMEEKPVTPVQNRSHDSSSHHIISKKNIILNRSSQSDFKKNSYFDSPRTLKELHPFTEEEGKMLQCISGREFNLRAMNEILKDMGRRLPDPLFETRKAFLSYMAKAFIYEKRDAVKISNETFTILPKDVREQENYLQTMENSNDPFKRKLAGIFEREKAYRILNAYSFCVKKEDRFTLHFWKSIELTKQDKEKILETAQYSYSSERKEGEGLGQILERAFVGNGVDRLEIIMPKEKVITSYAIKNSIVSQQSKKKISPKIYDRLIDYFGITIMNTWMSKLNIEYNEKEKKIVIEAPNSFIFSYINENYIETIKILINSHYGNEKKQRIDDVNYRWTFYYK